MISRVLVTISHFAVFATFDAVHGGVLRFRPLPQTTLIEEAQRKGEIVTTQFLVEVANVDKSAILRMTKPLEALGFLKRRQIHATNGKGRAWQYEVDLPEDMHRLIIDDFLMKSKRS